MAWRRPAATGSWSRPSHVSIREDATREDDTNWLFAAPVAIIFSCLGLVSRGLTHGYLNDTDPTPAAILIGLTMIVGHLVFLCAVPVALFTVRRRPMLLVIVMSAFMGYGAGSAILRLA